MSLIAIAIALSLTRAAPLPLMQTGMLGTDGYVAFLTIGPDGHWTGTGDQSGMLSPVELTQVVAATKAVVLRTTRGPACSESYNLRMLRLERGEVRYAPDCGPMAHYSVARVVELAESFTTMHIHPLVVRLDSWPPGDADRKQAIILRRDGVWSTDNSAGNSHPAQLADVIAAIDAARLEVEPAYVTFSCQVELSNDLAIPGRATLHWDTPCQSPGPSLAYALAKLVMLVGPTR